MRFIMSGLVISSGLPTDIVWLIVRQTDPKDLTFRLVCKDWNCVVFHCLKEVNAALRRSSIWELRSCSVQLILDDDPTICSEQLKTINSSVRKEVKLISNLLWASQLPAFERSAMIQTFGPAASWFW